MATPAPKVVYYPAPETPLTREEIQQVFARFASKDPIMAAFRQILVERLAGACVDNMDPRLTERSAGIVAGRMQEISDLQRELAEIHQAAATLRRSGVVEKTKKP